MEQQIENELRSLPVGDTRVIAGEAVTRWTENSWEIGTWGKKTTDLFDTVQNLVMGA
jgi:hypothetical protein